jgi:hypothetical protein
MDPKPGLYLCLSLTTNFLWSPPLTKLQKPRIYHSHHFLGWYNTQPITKLEMKFSMSALSRWRTKWGTNHFKILLKALEYGYSTRKTGLRYDGNPGKQVDVNTLEGFADSNLGVPRSQGSRSIRMNNAAITMTSKRHTTTDDSTMLVCEIEGFRVLMDEVGLKQDGPTKLYQDNKAAVQVAMNRG